MTSLPLVTSLASPIILMYVSRTIAYTRLRLDHPLANLPDSRELRGWVGISSDKVNSINQIFLLRRDLVSSPLHWTLRLPCRPVMPSGWLQLQRPMPLVVLRGISDNADVREPPKHPLLSNFYDGDKYSSAR
ncbi:hypothetical protein JAAARDRAFT_447465 [Jaapia argillacea MUCL 33604]|uniref:Uncharacterized protein n=1 Tax=Jaapia argillacea MUCL 33604 TaxID=933084 RepID=A0A067Q789_9AGAM|nr:hypothetical protein JAAARDRAFT_447465 [Jaapia argillacea MUCL 33604]